MARRTSHPHFLYAGLGVMACSCSVLYTDSTPASTRSIEVGPGGSSTTARRETFTPPERDADTTASTSALSPAAAQPAAAGPAHAHTAATGKIDVNLLPQGDPGASAPQVVWINEQPSRGDGVGAFRTVCEFSHMNYDDPIVYPKQPGMAHLHTYFGNSEADANSTALSLRSSGNSTCRGGTINRTGYWVPALLTATGRPVEPMYMDVYYKSGYNGIAASDIELFPTGLRMIAGDARSTTSQHVAYWGCRDHNVGHIGNMPDCPAGDALAMYIEFPQCWDGKNNDSSDHKSHMAYPRNGACPSTHPVPIPAITFNIYYDVTNAHSGGYRLASDMYDAALPGGYSVHGDWFDGWDRAAARTFVQKCIQAGVDCHSHLLGDGRAIE